MTTSTCRGGRASAGSVASWILRLAYVSAWIEAGVGELKVKFGVLLPEHPVDRTKHPCTPLSLAMAEQWLIAEDLAPLNWIVNSPASKSGRSSNGGASSTAISAHFEYSNSQCSDMYGPYRAVEIYYRGPGCQRADDGPRRPGGGGQVECLRVFYGPCCKYALSPVGKLATVWNVPLITSGGLVSGFAQSAYYTTLTRFIAPYHKMAEFLLRLLAKYDWWHLSLLFHDNLGPDKVKGYPMCFDVMQAIGKQIDARSKGEPSAADVDDDARTGNGTRPGGNYYVLYRDIFNQNYFDQQDWDVIMGGVRNASRGERVARRDALTTRGRSPRSR